MSSVHTVLRNAKYAGRWAWNTTMFLKNAETGKRTSVRRPKDEWIIDERPDLVIVVRLQLVAGAGYAECYTVPESHWIELNS